jgi:tetratricopeptide (TPR) repeat protein
MILLKASLGLPFLFLIFVFCQRFLSLLVMKIKLLIISVISLLFIRCTYSQDCVENINKLPMYGGVKKCKVQIEADNIFFKECDKDFKSRKEAASHMVMRGWQYFDLKKMDTSMMRFNQAWLLDSLNSEIYWGFANLLGLQGKFKESLPFFKKSLVLNSTNAKVWKDMSMSYGNLFISTNEIKYLNQSINSLKKAAVLDPKNPLIYGQLTSAYTYFVQKDSARKYLKITEQLDPAAINPDVRKLLDNKK